MTDASPRRSGDSLSDDLSFLLARASALSNAAGNAALAPLGLKVRSYSVLALAAEKSHPSQRELAEYLRLDPSQVVALVDDLQRQGLVVREPDPADRRANVIAATDDGLRLISRARTELQRAERELHAGLTEQDRATLGDLLRKAAALE